MIKLKSLLKEQAVFKSVTTALQQAVKTFNDSAATALANEKNKNFIGLVAIVNPDQTRSATNIDVNGERMPAQKYIWYIKYSEPLLGATGGMTILCTLTVSKVGTKDDLTNIGYSKRLSINTDDGSGKGSTYDLFDYSVFSDGATTPTDISSRATTFVNAIANLFFGHAQKGTSGSIEQITSRNTAKVWLNSGEKLIQDLKSVFNSIEIAPFTPEGKKNWKGMKKV